MRSELRRNQRKNQGFIVLLFTGTVISAAAAEPPSLPTAGSIGDTVKPAVPLQTPQPLVLPNAQPSAAPAPAAGSATLTVAGFRLSGNTLFSEAQLLPLIQSYVGRPITLAELYQAADRIAQFYQQHGYTLTSVMLPAQSVDAGIVQLQVIEGRVGDIKIDRKGYAPQGLRGYVAETRPGEVYRADHLENDLQTLNALPGLSARAVLQPGNQFGSSDVIIQTRHDPLDIIATVDNYGLKDVGEYRYSAGLTFNLGLAASIHLFGVHSNTNRLNYGYAAYSVPLNFSGLRFNADYGYAKFKVAPPFSADGKNKNFDAGLEQSFLHTGRNTLIGSLGYTRTDANTDFSGLSITDTKLNLMTVGTTFSHAGANGTVTQLTGGIHTNFSEATTSNRNRERLRAELDVQHLQPLFARFELLLHADGVYSPDPLADTEQLSIGGPTSIRGFPASDARGDQGYFAQATLRRPFGVGALVLLPRVFGDTGVIRRLDTPPGTDTHDSLTSVGTGFDLLFKKFSAKVDWSYPLDSTPTSDGRSGGRVYAAIAASF